MTDTTRAHQGDDLILLAITGAWVALQAAATLAVTLVALLLVLAGWRPSQAAAGVVQTSAPCAEPLPVVITPQALPPAAVPPLECLKVTELRALARTAGLSQLARRGRRADLLEALAA